MEPSFTAARVTLGLNYEQQGLTKEVIAEFRKVEETVPNDAATRAAGHALAKSGQTVEARQLQSEPPERAKKVYVPPYSIAILLAGLGEQSQALDWLNRGLQDRSLRPVWVRFDPRLDGLQRDDRFIQLMRSLGLN